MGGIVRGWIGLIDGDAIGGMPSGRIGTRSIVLLHTGTCRHDPPLQSQDHLQAAPAGVAKATSESKSQRIRPS